MIKMRIGIYEVIIKEHNSADYTDAIEETWSCNGVLHREDGPAKTITHLQSGRAVLKQFYEYGRLHRNDGPAEILIMREGDTGVLEREVSFYQYGIRKREHGKPAVETYDESSGRLIGEIFTNDQGDYHREGGPAVWWRCGNSGVMRLESYYVNDTLHRTNGPALVERDPITGIITEESYFLNGHRHRTDGPAVLERDGDTGKIVKSEIWANGSRCETYDKRFDLE